MKRVYRYRWVHFPSGRTETDAVECWSLQEFLDLIAGWNRVGAITWRASLSHGKGHRWWYQPEAASLTSGWINAQDLP